MSFRRCIPKSLSIAMSAAFLGLTTSYSASAQISSAHLVGRVAATAPVAFDLALPLRNQAALSQLQGELYNPQSPLYRHFLTPAQFDSEFAPLPQDYQALADSVRAQGLTVTGTHRDRLLLDVAGPAAAVEQAFGVRLDQYTAPSGRLFRAPNAALRLPSTFSALAVSVVGLNTSTIRRSFLQSRGSSLGGPIQGPGSGPYGGFSPLDIKAAYGLDTVPLEGQGQTLAVFELDSFTPSDIRFYENYFGLPRIPLTIIPTDNVSEQPGSGANETTLDIELVNALAPRASQILVYEGPNTTQGTLDTYAHIANDDIAKQVSTSWGSPEDQTSTATLNSENSIFAQMMTQGQSVFSAMGDAGAYDDGSTLSVDDPGSQPDVTGVGGTTLTPVSVGGVYQSETVWNNSTGAGGGGISAQWPIPSYQSGAIPSNSLGSTTMRNCPDVALNADPNTGYSIYYNGAWLVYGGTSPAAPLWASFTALVNQERALLGKSSLGLANTKIYAIGKGSLGSYAHDFHDVTQGNNKYYPAVTGYDDASGWGSFNGAYLLADLAGSTAPTAHSSGFSYPAGFNFFSLPYDDSAYTPAALFGAPGLSLYVWNGSSYTVSPTYPADTVRPGTGYWADFSQPVTTQFTGSAVNATVPFTGTTLAAGWNQIGDPFLFPIPLANLQFTTNNGTTGSFVSAEENNWISGVMYSYNPSASAYTPVSEGSSLVPGEADWVYATQPLTLQVPPP